ncbi:MAG: class I SAM-dependent methyltransferase [Terriglobia bacterium]
MPEKAVQSREYALGHSPRELERLTTQAKLLEPFTRRVFEQAGIGSGMKVLDVGSGPGDVAFLAAGMVGPEGKVTGTDRAPQAVEKANERAASLGHSNITFVQGDPAEMTFDQPFDAVVGRFVLMYYPNPAATLRRFVRHLRPGGIVAFQESDNSGARAFPPMAMWDRLFELMGRVLELSGAEPRMGLKLYSAFIDAGLPAPSLQADVGIIGAQDPNVGHIGSFLVQGLRSVLPAIVKHGLATAEELDIETYGQRMIEELRATGGVWLSPPFVGAWARTPA